MTPPTCERCSSVGEPTEDSGEWLCPRCGIWIAIDGAELGPRISVEEALARYEAFAIKSAARIVEEAKRLGIVASPPVERVLVPPSDEQRKVHALTYDGVQLEHEDGWIYEYVAGEEPRRVRRVSTSAKGDE